MANVLGVITDRAGNIKGFAADIATTPPVESNALFADPGLDCYVTEVTDTDVTGVDFSSQIDKVAGDSTETLANRLAALAAYIESTGGRFGGLKNVYAAAVTATAPHGSEFQTGGLD